MLPDHFFLLYRDGKKGLGNSLYYFCSTALQILWVVDWSLIAADLYIEATIIQ